MIRHTLLPEKEIKSLKAEYRMRFLITLLFFLSCAVVIGIGALTPVYMFSYSQEREALQKTKVLQKSREESGMNNVLEELVKTDKIIKKLQSKKQSKEFGHIIYQIISHKTPLLTIDSFIFATPVDNASSTLDISIAGRSATREALVEFKKRLESDPLITNIELPVSDLAKSKGVSYSIKLSIMTAK